MINTIWFVVLAFMLAGYAVLDGFDLGVGTLHLLLGRDTRERATLIDTIGPVWNGNEVWLLAAGGSMVVAFPHVYAASFSGFYLALMLVLWLLLLRGLGIEFRHQIDHDMWRHAWDVAFSLSSALLALLFGVAVGNVLRGVPLDAHGEFQGTFALMLNPFALLGGLLSVAVLSLHGATWVALKTEGALQARAGASPARCGGRRWRCSRRWSPPASSCGRTSRANFVEHPWLLLIARHHGGGRSGIMYFPGAARRPARLRRRRRADRGHSRLGRRGPLSVAAARRTRQRPSGARHLQLGVTRRQPPHRARHLPVGPGAGRRVPGERLSRLARQGAGRLSLTSRRRRAFLMIRA